MIRLEIAVVIGILPLLLLPALYRGGIYTWLSTYIRINTHLFHPLFLSKTARDGWIVECIFSLCKAERGQNKLVLIL